MPASDLDLAALARQRILASELPLSRRSRVYGGGGSGQPCALCRRPIAADEVEYEVEIPDAGVTSPLAFHIECCAVWRSTCVHLLDEPR